MRNNDPASPCGACGHPADWHTVPECVMTSPREHCPCTGYTPAAPEPARVGGDAEKVGRVIKFRAWDLDNFFMFYSDREHDIGEGPIIWQCTPNGIHFEELQMIDRMVGSSYHDQSFEYRKPNQVLMQFTGLLDKNGKEIYEGDIVSWLGYGEDTDWMKETEQGRDVVTMNRFPYYWLENEEHDYGGEGFVHPGQIAVIGNIYEHPDLLEANDDA